jgi:hypothetical protein
MGFVLYGGAAIALQLGHRRSVDFDFFSTEPLDKEALRATFSFIHGAAILQDELNTLVVSALTLKGHISLRRILPALISPRRRSKERPSWKRR